MILLHFYSILQSGYSPTLKQANNLIFIADFVRQFVNILENNIYIDFLFNN